MIIHNLLMPQLDLYTYFTQFHWLLFILFLLFFLISTQFLPFFQSLFETRNFLLSHIELQSQSSLKSFGPIDSKNSRIQFGINSSVHLTWDSIFDQHIRRSKSNVSSSHTS